MGVPAGDSREQPLIAETEEDGRTYGGWDCQDCGKRISYPGSIPDSPVPGDYAWVQCRHCNAVRCYVLGKATFSRYVDIDLWRRAFHRQ